MVNAPIGDCNTAALHLATHTQSYGSLLAIDNRDLTICACSANIHEYTGRPAEELLGRHSSELFAVEDAACLSRPRDDAGPHVPRIMQTLLNHQKVLIASHSVGEMTLVEIERFQPETAPLGPPQRIAFLQALAATVTVESAAELLMQTVASTTHFDRVMLYEFLPDWHGRVVGEVLKPGVGGYLGLHFPGSDIPANARHLYLLNWQRIIADVYSEAVPVVATPGAGQIDFSFSQLRAVHPVHIEYLKNIGVAASFSISIIAGGKLWGLVACHHLTPNILSLTCRQHCEELSRATSIHMGDMIAIRRKYLQATLRETVAEIMGAMRAQESSKRNLIGQLNRIRLAYRAQGALMSLDDKEFHSGEIPDEMSRSALANWLETLDRSSVTACATIPAALASHPALIRMASGLLYLPLRGQDYLLLIRAELVETVRWAGKPQGDINPSSEGAPVLTPRASFEIWSQQTKGTCAPWEDSERLSASRLRELLIEYVDKVDLEYAAMHDALTGLPNRMKFEHALEDAVRQGIRDDTLSAVFMLDLDGFKPVNDAMGHAVGDEVLIEVGRRLKLAMRGTDVVARLGGDEFAIVQYRLNSPGDADRTAERILHEIRQPFDIKGQSVAIGVSIGVSLCPQHGIDQDELLEDADLALYQAKRAGRNTFKAFTDSMHVDRQQKHTVRDELVATLGGNSLSLVYQPVVSSKTGALKGLEAFARWEHPARGQLVARDFLPQFEQSQLMSSFAEWGIRYVLQQGSVWMKMGLPLVPISVNMSARQFLNVDLAELCTALSRELAIGLEWVRIDLDAAALHADFQRTADKVAALAQLGVLTNIDHFGQGLVALNRLMDVKINQLKISGTHFEPAADPTRSDALMAIIASIGKVMHVPIVATQIETPAMEARALSLGADLLQGNHISPALSCDDTEQWLRDRINR